MDATEHERHDPGNKRPDDSTGYEERHRARRHDEGGHRCGLNEQRQPHGAREPDAVGELTGQHGADHGAEAEHHPVAGTDGEAPAEAARDEVDEEHHVRHEARRIEAILDIQRTQRQARAVVDTDARERRAGGLLGPSTPRQHGQRQGHHTEATPRLDQTHSQQ